MLHVADVDLTQLLTVDGITKLIELCLIVMAVVSSILSRLGYSQAAAKVVTMAGEAKDLVEQVALHKDKVEVAGKALAGIIQGVEDFRGSASPEQSNALKVAIQDNTKALNVEHVVLPLVKAVTEGQGSVSGALAVSSAPAKAA